MCGGTGRAMVRDYWNGPLEGMRSQWRKMKCYECLAERPQNPAYRFKHLSEEPIG